MTTRTSTSPALFALFVLAFSLASAAPSKARAEPASRIYVGTYLHDVTNFDQRSGTYQVDLDVWAKWLGTFEPGEIRLQNEAGDIQRDDLGESQDGDWHTHRWRIRGTLRGEFPLHRFPFDVQTLSVVFELPELRGELVPDLAGSGMSERFSVTGWVYEAQFSPRVRRMVYATDLGTLENEGRSSHSRRVHFDVTLHRPPVTVAVKLFLPLFLLLLIALLSLYLGPDLVDPRAGIGVTVLLACFAFQFTIAGTIPDVAYLTIVDSLFIVAYALTTIALIVTVGVYWLHRNGRPSKALAVDRLFRVLIPVVGIAASVFVLKAPPSARARAPRPYVRTARAPSVRNVVRVGTLQLTSPLAGPLRPALRVGLVRTTAAGERIAELAEEAPSVSNDMLRFLANGHLEVHWHLRSGLAWSDGEPLTSDDFRFALEVSPNEHIVEVATPDARTLVLTYDDKVAEALDGFPPLPRHQLRREATLDAGFEAVREAQRTRPLASAGPYYVSEFVANDHAIALANPHYIGTRPSIGRVELRGFADEDALVRAFDSGAIDIVVPNALAPRQLDALEASHPGSLYTAPSEDLIALAPDFAVAWLADPNVRRALLLALDREALQRDLLDGLGSIAASSLASVRPPDEDLAMHDPERARAMLGAAGASGRTLRLVHLRRRADTDLATAIASQLEAVGLVVERVAVAPGSPESRARDHGGLMLSTIRSDDDADPRRYWNLARVAGRFASGTRNAAYDDATADLLERWTHALYPERRHQLRERIALSFSHRLPLLPLFFAPDRTIAAPALDGWDTGVRFGENLADWHFAEPGAAR